jgi:hypothetical protein
MVWRTRGSKDYPDAKVAHLRQLWRRQQRAGSRVWKCDLQQKICNPHGLSVSSANQSRQSLSNNTALDHIDRLVGLIEPIEPPCSAVPDVAPIIAS